MIMVETIRNILKPKICHFHSAFCARKMTVTKIGETLFEISAQTLILQVEAAQVE